MVFSSLYDTAAENLGHLAVVSSLLGAGLTLPFYGGEAYGLQAIGQEAITQQSAALISLASTVRTGPGLIMFLIGLLLLATPGS